MSSYATYNDAQLLALLRDSDKGAFTEIYHRYWDRMLAIGINLTADKDAAKEIVQDLFIGIWDRRERFQAEKLENYLATAVKFNFFKQMERRKRQKEIEASLQADKDLSALDQQIETRFLEEYLKGQIERLPEKCRLVFNYSRIQEMSNKGKHTTTYI